MIPKIIHYVWLGDKPIPEEHQKYIEGWKKVLPDYKFMFWTDKNFDFSKSPYSSQAYKLKKYGFVPDYIRASVLEEYGGIYLDTDVEVLKSFDDLLDCDFFTSLENDGYIETAVLGASAHSPFVKKIKEFYENFDFVNKKGKMNLTPSPFYFSYILNKDFSFKINGKAQTLIKDNTKIQIYDREYFAPIDFTTKKMNVTENTYAIHHFANSWAGKAQNAQEKFTLFIYKTFGRRFFAFCTQSYIKHYFKKIRKMIKKREKNKDK